MSLKNISKFFFLFVMFCCGLSVLADENWSKALDAIEKNDFAQARMHLAQQSNKGYGSYRLIGALHEKNKEFPQALIAYRRGQKEVEMTTFFDTVSNIVRVKTALGHKIHIFYEYFLTLCFLLWVLFFQILFVLGLLLLVVELRIKKKSFLLRMVAILLVCFGAIGYYVVQKVSQQERAVVIDKGYLRIGPDNFYQTQKSLAPGDEILFSQKNAVGSWYKSVSDGVVGWVSGSLLEKI